MDHVYAQILDRHPRWEVIGREARRLVRQDEVDDYNDTDSDDYD